MENILVNCPRCDVPVPEQSLDSHLVSHRLYGCQSGGCRHRYDTKPDTEDHIINDHATHFIANLQPFWRNSYMCPELQLNHQKRQLEETVNNGGQFLKISPKTPANTIPPPVSSSQMMMPSPVSQQSVQMDHTYQQPSRTQPTYQQPFVTQPTYQQPSGTQPTYQQPFVTQPTYLQPFVTQPTYQQLSRTQPTYQQPQSTYRLQTADHPSIRTIKVKPPPSPAQPTFQPVIHYAIPSQHTRIYQNTNGAHAFQKPAKADQMYNEIMQAHNNYPRGVAVRRAVQVLPAQTAAAAASPPQPLSFATTTTGQPTAVNNTGPSVLFLRPQHGNLVDRDGAPILLLPLQSAASATDGSMASTGGGVGVASCYSTTTTATARVVGAGAGAGAGAGGGAGAGICTVAAVRKVIPTRSNNQSTTYKVLSEMPPGAVLSGKVVFTSNGGMLLQRSISPVWSGGKSSGSQPTGVNSIASLKPPPQPEWDRSQDGEDPFTQGEKDPLAIDEEEEDDDIMEVESVDPLAL